MAWEQGRPNTEKSERGKRTGQRKQIQETNQMHCWQLRETLWESNDFKKTRLQRWDDKTPMSRKETQAQENRLRMKTTASPDSQTQDRRSWNQTSETGKSWWVQTEKRQEDGWAGGQWCPMESDQNPSKGKQGLKWNENVQSSLHSVQAGRGAGMVLHGNGGNDGISGCGLERQLWACVCVGGLISTYFWFCLKFFFLR